jgi:hypothetical protein
MVRSRLKARQTDTFKILSMVLRVNCKWHFIMTCQCTQTQVLIAAVTKTSYTVRATESLFPKIERKSLKDI